jgi:flagellar hook-length control protein FliK
VTSLGSGAVGSSAAPGVALSAASPADAQATDGATSGDPADAAGYGVDLERAIEAVHATIELATRQGLAQARIALAPEELGEIRIHLTQSAQGLIARVTAESPAAAQALADGHAELRQSLSSLGLSALHLGSCASEHSGAGLGAQTNQQRSAHDPRAGEAPQHTRRASTDEADDDMGGSEEAPVSEPSSIPRPLGALVDVLA